MARRPSSIRFNQSERQVIQAVARKSDTPWTRWVRNAALDRAARELQRDVPAFRNHDGRERDS